MQAGLPGTGIGGFFYILLAFLMLPAEIFKLIKGESSLERWRMVGRQLWTAVCIIAGVEGAGWILSDIFHLRAGTVTVSMVQVGSTGLILAVPFLLPLAALSLVLGTIWVMGLFNRETIVKS